MIEPTASPAGPLPPSEAIQSLQPDDVRVAAQVSYELLEPMSGADWTRRAGDLDWDCRHTLQHLVYALDHYSLFLATPSPENPPRARNAYPDLSNGDLLVIMQRRAAVLAAVATAAAPTARGFHTMGSPDPAGYVAMACTEILVHTGDIGRGQGVDHQPPEALCQRVVARLFPWATTDVNRTPRCPRIRMHSSQLGLACIPRRRVGRDDQDPGELQPLTPRVTLSDGGRACSVCHHEGGVRDEGHEGTGIRAPV